MLAHRELPPQTIPSEHTCNDPGERQRVEAMGARVEKMDPAPDGKSLNAQSLNAQLCVRVQCAILKFEGRKVNDATLTKSNE
jgi:hypothetical protein